MSIQHVIVSTTSVRETLHRNIYVSTVPLAMPAETAVVFHVKCHSFSSDFVKTVISTIFSMLAKYEVLRQRIQ